MNKDIIYTRTGLKGLDMIAPLWVKLNEYYKEHALKFSDHYTQMTWEKRKPGLVEKGEKGNILVDIAKDKDTTTGYCVSTVVEGTGEVESIFIEKEYRRHGIGDDFMKRALTWMDAQNVTRKTVSVAAGNEEVFDFYKRFGFYPRATILMQSDSKERTAMIDG